MRVSFDTRVTRVLVYDKNDVNLLDELYNYEEEHGELDFNSEAEAIKFLHPELDLEQLALAEEVYEGLRGIPFFSIDEVPLLGDNIPDNLIQILNGNNN